RPKLLHDCFRLEILRVTAGKQYPRLSLLPLLVGFHPTVVLLVHALPPHEPACGVLEYRRKASVSCGPQFPDASIHPVPAVSEVKERPRSPQPSAESGKPRSLLQGSAERH